MTRVETIGDCTLYLGDCQDVIASIEAEVVITDPPYGLGGANRNRSLRKRRGVDLKSDYDTDRFDDTAAYVDCVVAPVVAHCIARYGRVAVTPGLRNMRRYPEPAHTGTFQYPGSTVMSCWGPMLWQPILYYGRDPHQGKLRPDSRPNCNDVDRDTPHPCPKPLKQWTWLVERASLPGETVFDPFMGSGTTGVACVNLGRRFVGVEIEPKHFDTACRRIEEACAQPRLFGDAA